MPFVSITRLRLRSPFFTIPFFWHAIRSLSQAKRATGNIGARTLADAHRVFWTASVWKDEASMRAYLTSGAHRKAMPKLMGWCDEASVANWTQAEPQLPDWNTAHRRLVAEGRKSKVHRPSPAHAAGEAPPPPKM